MTCYLRNGTRSPEAVPCDHNAILDGRHTSCCNPTDLCLSNGLCRNPKADNRTNYAWAWGCTDSTYTDPACAHYCDKWATQNHQLAFSCAETDTWCCHKGYDVSDTQRINRTNTACCSKSEQVFKAPWATVVATASWSGTPLPIATLISSAPTQSAIATATDAASTLGDVDATPTHSLAIGLGTGLGVGVVIALALGWVVMRRRRQRKEKTSTKSTNHGYGEMAAQDIVETDGRERLTEKDGKEVAELQDTGKSAEVVGDVYRAELPGCPVTDIKRS